MENREKDGLRTSTRFLDRLRDGADSEAVVLFVGRYQGVIWKWCRAKGLQVADADDISQAVIMRALNHFQNTAYDRTRGGFRKWLGTVTRNACINFFKRDESARYRPLADDIMSLEKAVDDLANDELIRAALDSVEKEVSPRDWDIYRRTTFECHKSAAIAAEFGMKELAVHKVVSRVRGRLKDKYAELEGNDDEPEAMA